VPRIHARQALGLCALHRHRQSGFRNAAAQRAPALMPSDFARRPIWKDQGLVFARYSWTEGSRSRTNASSRKAVQATALTRPECQDVQVRQPAMSNTTETRGCLHHNFQEQACCLSTRALGFINISRMCGCKDHCSRGPCGCIAQGSDNRCSGNSSCFICAHHQSALP
jgi:hypothetical protein